MKTAAATRKPPCPILAQALAETHRPKPWAVIKLTRNSYEHCCGADSCEEAVAKMRADGGEGLIVISMA